MEQPHDSIGSALRQDSIIKDGKVPLVYLANLGAVVGHEAGVSQHSSLGTIIGNPQVNGHRTADQLMHDVFDPLAYVGLVDYAGFHMQRGINFHTAVGRLVDNGIFGDASLCPDPRQTLRAHFHEPDVLVTVPLTPPSVNEMRSQIQKELSRTLSLRIRQRATLEEWQQRRDIWASNLGFYPVRLLKISLGNIPEYADQNLTQTLQDWEEAYKGLIGGNYRFTNNGFEGNINYLNQQAFLARREEKPMPIVTAYPAFVPDGDRLVGKETTAIQWFIRRMKDCGMTVRLDFAIPDVRTDILAVSDQFKRLAGITRTDSYPLHHRYSPRLMDTFTLPPERLDNVAGQETIQFISLIRRDTNMPHLMPGQLAPLETILAYIYFLFQRKKKHRAKRGTEFYTNTDEIVGKRFPVGNITREGEHVNVIWDGDSEVNIGVNYPASRNYECALLLADRN